MEVVTDRFLREIRGSHTVYSYVDATGPNLEQTRLTATGGSITVDITAAVRRYAKFSFADPLEVLEPILSRPGTELRPYRGVKYADGTIEVAPMGVLRISTATLTDSVGGSRDIQVECFDRSRTVQRDKFTVPYIIPSGTNLVDAIKGILARTFDDLTYDAISSTMTTTAPLFYDANDDPWQAATDLARSLGCELFFDPRGEVVIAPPVDIDALPSPDFDYIEGPGCTMLDLSKKYTDEPGFNGIVLTGESVGDEAPPVRSIVWDSEPHSATYHLGEYGEVPMFVQDSNVKTQSDADNAASALLKGLLGFSAQLTLSVILNPALDAGDVIKVVRERSNVSALFTIDGITMPMSAAEFGTMILRQKRVA